MFGKYLHEDIAHMAAAYLFHLATTQAFLDGNKRTSVLCALTFLDMNGFELLVTPGELYNVAISVATNQLSKADLADWFREHVTPIQEP